METSTGHTLIERYLAMINQRDWHQIHTLFAPGYLYHGASGGAGEPTPPEAIARYFHHLIQALPDLEMHADVIVTTDDFAILRWTASGTHRGDYLGHMATGQHGTQTGTAIWRLAEGRFVEGWQNQDDHAFIPGA